VDTEESLTNIIKKIQQIELPVIFPVHPRTRRTLEKISSLAENLILSDPLSYIDFMNLVLNSTYVISDSGGIQEETTYLGVPCFTLRDTTERPITLTMGSNQLVSVDTLLESIKLPKKGSVPPFWDGQTAGRILSLIKRIL
jgi:UDP-N-acetylglucosamine 2-epimerase (non-hydrolysing)